MKGRLRVVQFSDCSAHTFTSLWFAIKLMNTNRLKSADCEQGFVVSRKRPFVQGCEGLAQCLNTTAGDKRNPIDLEAILAGIDWAQANVPY